MTTPWLLDLALENRTPGVSPYSVELARECAPSAKKCARARHSSFYDMWVRQESVASGKARYSIVVEGLERALASLTCRRLDGSKIQHCEPDDTLDLRIWKPWGPKSLIAAVLGVAILESGLREDVQMGRGRSGHTNRTFRQFDDALGEGRGPANEACFTQQNPRSAWRFVSAKDGGVDQDTLDLAARGNRAAREAVVVSLLGPSAEQIERCWKAGLRNLANARWHCSWASPKIPWSYGMMSYYVSGTTCGSPNSGKTRARERAFLNLYAQIPKS